MKDDLTPVQISSTIDKIKRITQEGANALYVIIARSAQVDKDPTIYGSRFGQKTGVTMNLELMPPHVQKMIYLFIEKYHSEAQTDCKVNFS